MSWKDVSSSEKVRMRYQQKTLGQCIIRHSGWARRKNAGSHSEGEESTELETGTGTERRM